MVEKLHDVHRAKRRLRWEIIFFLLRNLSLLGVSNVVFSNVLLFKIFQFHIFLWESPIFKAHSRACLYVEVYKTSQHLNISSSELRTTGVAAVKFYKFILCQSLNTFPRRFSRSFRCFPVRYLWYAHFPCRSPQKISDLGSEFTGFPHSENILWNVNNTFEIFNKKNMTRENCLMNYSREIITIWNEYGGFHGQSR